MKLFATAIFLITGSAFAQVQSPRSLPPEKSNRAKLNQVNGGNHLQKLTPANQAAGAGKNGKKNNKNKKKAGKALRTKNKNGSK